MIIDFLVKKGYKTVDDSFYIFISDWIEWYKGKVASFHKYTVYNGIETTKKERYSLGMAKRVCEDWANLLLNEKVKITAAESFDKTLQEILTKNNFRVRANQLAELTFAFGTGAFVEYLSGKEVVIDYIRAEMIYPLKWDNGDITECAFASEKVIDGKKYLYIQMHVLKNKKYVIKNFLVEEASGKEVTFTDGTLPEVNTGSTAPLFQIVTPNIINNIDLDNPLGISVFANALDILKGVDLVYDSYCNEFRLGKKRILVPLSMAKINYSDGTIKPAFDPDDTEFYAFEAGDDKKNEIKEIDMNIRAEEHEAGLQKNLDLLSYKCGLGSDHYSFRQGDVKTATEVISEKSDLYQNIKKHEIILEAVIIKLSKAVAFLSGHGPDVEITVTFDDSIIEDTAATRQQALLEFNAGIIDEVEYMVKVYKLTEEQAIEAYNKVKARKPKEPPEADPFVGD